MAYKYSHDAREINNSFISLPEKESQSFIYYRFVDFFAKRKFIILELIKQKRKKKRLGRTSEKHLTLNEQWLQSRGFIPRCLYVHIFGFSITKKIFVISLTLFNETVKVQMDSNIQKEEISVQLRLKTYWSSRNNNFHRCVVYFLDCSRSELKAIYFILQRFTLGWVFTRVEAPALVLL